MICQECEKRPATLHFTKIINGEKTEFHICESCAREKGEGIPGSPNSFSIHSLLSGLLDFEPGAADARSQLQSPRCDNCGLTYSQFSKLGRFGCDSCYKHFNDRLDPLFKRVHGSVAHIGKIPKRAGGRIQTQREINQLRMNLQNSIENEEFEQAASLRDRIRQLEKIIADSV